MSFTSVASGTHHGLNWSVKKNISSVIKEWRASWFAYIETFPEHKELDWEFWQKALPRRPYTQLPFKSDNGVLGIPYLGRYLTQDFIINDTKSFIDFYLINKQEISKFCKIYQEYEVLISKQSQILAKMQEEKEKIFKEIRYEY